MNESEPRQPQPQDAAPQPADKARFNGPLHLQSYLGHLDEALEKALRGAVGHSVSHVFGVFCPCRRSSVNRARPQHDASVGSGDARADAARSRRLSDILHAQFDTGQSSGEPSSTGVCRMFFVKLNDEAGVVHAVCRRCQRVVVIYDRALYWGTPRKGPRPEVYPYSCGCGGHGFEVALGLLYADEPLDENDLDTLTVAVRCSSCGETAVIFDDEAT